MIKISSETYSILRNFAEINPSLKFTQGNTLRTISQNGKVVVAEANIKENFPQDFVIYDLNSLLGVVSIFDEPEIECEEKSLAIKNGNRSINYLYADDSYVTDFKSVRMKDTVVEFDLNEDDFKQWKRASDVLDLETLSIESSGDGTPLRLVAKSSRRDDTFKIDFEDIVVDQKFTANFSKSNLKLLEGPYRVTICAGAANFQNKNVDLQYWVATERDSEF